MTSQDLTALNKQIAWYKDQGCDFMSVKIEIVEEMIATILRQQEQQYVATSREQADDHGRRTTDITGAGGGSGPGRIEGHPDEGGQAV